jgi:hypothetical protein
MIKVLAAGQFAAGDHVVTWSGQGDSGAPLPAGVYFLRMTAPRWTGTQKIIYRGR